MYAKKGTTLYVKHGSKTIAKKKYKTSGYQTISIKKQKAGETITFFVSNKKGRSKYVEKAVEDATAPKKPAVIVDDPEGEAIKVTGEKGTAVYVKDKNSSWYYIVPLEKKKQIIYLGEYFRADSLVLPIEGEETKIRTYQVKLVDAWGNESKSVAIEMQ